MAGATENRKDAEECPQNPRVYENGVVAIYSIGSKDFSEKDIEYVFEVVY